jgi:hypothetical protein
LVVKKRAFILVALFGVASSYFQVLWVDSSHQSVTVKAVGIQDEVDECLESSREAKLRFEMRLCRKRSSWLDSCEGERSQHHSVSYDSITESYKVVTDRLDDDLDPVAVGIPSRKEAIGSATTVEGMPLSFLAQDELELPGHERGYLQVRVVFICKGSVNRTLAQLSQLLTFGIVNVVESDSGWMDFPLQRKKS